LLSLGAALLFAAGPAASARLGDDRTISFYHIHTQETLTVQYKKDGKFVPDALKQINHIMRDWRKNQEIAIDPNTIDIIWEMHEELGSKEPVNIICGYRSRETNEMLRRTVGGQASQSQHITGKAVDITFPDVPLKRMRYSAMIRERGGVGYYPTSGVPFVHVDTSRVRYWPRMPRDELALLFPSGHSQYEPADGRPITPADVRAARQRKPDLAQEMAQFFALRDAPKPAVQVADATPAAPVAVPPPAPAVRPRPPAQEQRMAVGAPLPPPETTTPEAKPTVLAALETGPKLVGAPKLVDRPSKFVRKLPDADQSRLDMLVQLAQVEGRVESDQAAKPASLVTGSTQPAAAAPPPAARPELTKETSSKAAPPRPVLASLTPDFSFPKRQAETPATEEQAKADPATAEPPGEGSSERSGWLTAPEYDDDHPDEMSYRPFALAPLLTDTSSFDDPALTTMVHPDAAETLDLLDEEGTVLPMRFGTGHAETMTWAQAFSGDAVNVAAISTPEPAAPAGPRLVERSVKTLPR
jgi:uncharacterized protein YcbK (DUF882 family)